MDKYTEIEKFYNLKERGIISEEEFKKEKEKILNLKERGMLHVENWTKREKEKNLKPTKIEPSCTEESFGTRIFFIWCIVLCIVLCILLHVISWVVLSLVF